MIYLVSPPANEVRKSYPYSLVYLSSYLRKNGFENQIIDCDVLGYSVKGLVSHLERNEASIVGITGYSRYRFAAYAVAREIKKTLPHCTIIVGGRHFSALAEESLNNISEIDIVVRGEGEITLKELCKAIANRESFSNVAGITYRENTRIVSTPDRGYEKDIERFSYHISDLPKGPYHLRERVSLKKSSEISNPISVMTSRGCSGRCVYCCMSAGRVRFRDSKAVVDEIEEKSRLTNTNELGIFDSSFTVKKSHVIGICEEILRRKLKLKWSCQSRANIDVEVLKLMKEAGCVAISVGIESASTKVLKAIKKEINLDQVMEFLRMCQRVNISALTYFMVSLPEETEEEAEETFRFIRKITPLVFKPALQITQIYPDAKLYYIAKEKGLLPEDFDWFRPYTNQDVRDLGGRENMPFYIENLGLGYLKYFMERYKKYYFKHFYYRDEFKTNIIKGMKSLILDWENESTYRKINRLKNGIIAVYGTLSRNY